MPTRCQAGCGAELAFLADHTNTEVMVGSEVMELGTPRRVLKGLCTLEPSCPDMRGVGKSFLFGGRERGVLVHPRAKCILVTCLLAGQISVLACYPHLCQRPPYKKGRAVSRVELS